MALVNASATAAKNAVMIVRGNGASFVNKNIQMGNIRGGAYICEHRVWTDEGNGAWVTLLNSGYIKLAETEISTYFGNYSLYYRVRAQNDVIAIDTFTSAPPVTGGTPRYTTTTTKSDAMVAGLWKYDSTYFQLISFTNNDITSYMVYYNANGGSVTPTSAVYSGTPLTLPTPTRSGYTFNGWYTAATGGTLVNSPYTPTANITLYAQWTPITYSVTYDANGGTGTAPAIQSGSSSYTVATNTFTRSGYSFNGWNTASDGTGTSYSEGSTITPSANTILYAQWASTTPENTIHVQDSAKATNVYVEEVLAQHFYIQDVQVF